MIRGICILTLLAVFSSVSAREATQVFDEEQFTQLRFLEGRWTGTTPDGSAFFEAYDFPQPTQLRSQRFADASFDTAVDGSTVSLLDGEVISQWGQFTWRATELGPGLARFEPIEAPSSFSWRRVGDDTVEVTQHWRDEHGEAQSYALTLRRID